MLLATDVCFFWCVCVSFLRAPLKRVVSSWFLAQKMGGQIHVPFGGSPKKQIHRGLNDDTRSRMTRFAHNRNGPEVDGSQESESGVFQNPSASA